MEEQKQDATVTPTPTSEGQSVEQLKAQHEREKQGILNDLRSERERRQQNEQELATYRASASAVPSVAGSDPVDALFQEKMKPLMDTVQQLQQEKQMSKALKFIAKKEKIDEDDVLNSAAFKELLDVVQSNGIRFGDPLKEAQIGYELLEKRRITAKQQAESEEVARQAAISGNSSIPSGSNPGNSGLRTFTNEQIRQMSLDEYRANHAAIKAAEKAGLIR